MSLIKEQHYELRKDAFDFLLVVLMSEKRCKLLLNALTKVIYSCIRAKYGVAVKNKAKPVKQAKKKAKSKPKKRLNQASDSDSEFDQSSLDDLSLDSDE